MLKYISYYLKSLYFDYKSYYYNLCNLIYKNMYDETNENFIQKSLSDYSLITLLL